MIKHEYRFPEKWYIEGVSGRSYSFNKYCASKKYNSCNFAFFEERYYYEDGNNMQFSTVPPGSRIEITWEQFEQYVLNLPKQEIYEDYSYLIPILKALNIK